MADSDDGTDQDHQSVGDWTAAADGNVSLTTGSTYLYLGAMSPNGSILMNAGATASVYCGPTRMVLSNDEAGVGTVHVSAGLEGTLLLDCGPLDEGPTFELTPETMTLQIGPPDTGACILMTPESINISVGPEGEGAMIEITPESITLKVAEVTFTLTAEGITEDVAEVTREMTAEGHNFTAAETEFNVGVQGQTAEGPTQEEEVEAGTVENETLGSDTTDAAKNVDAAIQITE
jgi:hypothetical protein